MVGESLTTLLLIFFHTCLKEIIPKLEKVFGLLSDDVFDSKNSLALRYRDLKNISSSSKLFIDLENIASKKYGAQHVRTLRIARHLATNHKLEGNYLKAEKIYKRMLKVYEKKSRYWNRQNGSS